MRSGIEADIYVDKEDHTRLQLLHAEEIEILDDVWDTSHAHIR